MGTGTPFSSPTVRVKRVLICLSQGKHVSCSPQTVGKTSPWPFGGASVWFMAQKQEKRNLFSAGVRGGGDTRTDYPASLGLFGPRGSVDFVEYVQTTCKKSWEDQRLIIKEGFRQKLEMPTTWEKNHKYWLTTDMYSLMSRTQKEWLSTCVGRIHGCDMKKGVFGRAEKETEEQLQERKKQLYTAKPKECEANLSQD